MWYIPCSSARRLILLWNVCLCIFVCISLDPCLTCFAGSSVKVLEGNPWNCMAYSSKKVGGGWIVPTDTCAQDRWSHTCFQDIRSSIVVMGVSFNAAKLYSSEQLSTTLLRWVVVIILFGEQAWCASVRVVWTCQALWCIDCCICLAFHLRWVAWAVSLM